jgi:histidinol-phosphate aminotransferase
MSPTAATGRGPAAPAGYAWEATSEQVAERYGVPLEAVVRFDLNTSPAPPGIVARVLAAGRFETPLSEYPPSDYRRLVEAAAARYGVEPNELLVGAGADEVLDLCAKAFLPAGGAAVVPTPTYAMYRVLTEQRAATVLPVPRLPAAEGYALDRPATRAAAARADVVWLCSPNNPTGLPEPDGSIAALLGELLGDAAADQRVPPAVVLDEAYAEFVGRSLVDLRHAYPRLVVVRTASKAYAMAGLRVGFAVARRETIAELEPYRPPGSVATTSVTVVTEALLDPTAMVANVTRVAAERTRLTAALEALGWPVGPSVTNFLVVDLGSPERAGLAAEGLLRRGIVPRTFGAGHPLAGGLRLTVRTPAEDDRLLAAAAEIATELPSVQDPPDEAGAVEPEEDR